MSTGRCSAATQVWRAVEELLQVYAMNAFARRTKNRIMGTVVRETDIAISMTLVESGWGKSGMLRCWTTTTWRASTCLQIQASLVVGYNTGKLVICVPVINGSSTMLCDNGGDKGGQGDDLVW